MARREITQYFDDLSNEPLQQHEVHIVSFSVNGVEYAIDLSAENADKFLKDLEPYINAARKVTSGRGRTQSLTINPLYNAKDVRTWAAAEGHDISPRGKLPQHIIDAYLAAQQ